MSPVEEIGMFGDVPLQIEAQLDRRPMCVREILDLRPGSVVPMTRSAGENIDICVAGRVIGYGEVVIIENSVGVRITDFMAEERE
jgi:flagellar motor switch protein FliN/FliY